MRDHRRHLADRGETLGADHLALALFDGLAHDVELVGHGGNFRRTIFVDATAVITGGDAASTVA